MHQNAPKCTKMPLIPPIVPLLPSNPGVHSPQSLPEQTLKRPDTSKTTIRATRQATSRAKTKPKTRYIGGGRNYLPGEQADHAEVDGHVRDPGGLVPLLHLRHHRRRHRPRDHDARPGIQVRAGEELLRPEEGVDGALDRGERSEAEQEGSRVVVAVADLRNSNETDRCGTRMSGSDCLVVVSLPCFTERGWVRVITELFASLGAGNIRATVITK